MIRPTRLPLLLFSAALLSACESAVPVVRIERPPMPAYLLQPLPRPPLPPEGVRLTQGMVAELLVQQDATIEGYEARLAEIARLEAASAAAAADR